MKKLALMTCLLITAGCGHNTYLENEITGMKVEIPIGDGTLGISIGSSKSVRAVVRGGSSFETSSSHGGGLFSGSGGQSKITQFKSNIQLNEANIVKVMTSPECPDAAKCILASNLAGNATAPYFPGSVLQTKESTIHIGKAAILSNNVEKLSDKPQGLNLLVDRTADVIGTNIVNHTLDTTGKVVHDVTNPLEGTVGEVKETVKEVKQTISATMADVKQAIVFVCIAVICIGILLLISSIRSRKDRVSKTIRVDTTPPDQTGYVDEADATITDEDVSPQKKQEKTEDEKSSFWDKVKTVLKWIFEAIKTLIGWIMLIPPETRKQIGQYIMGWIKSKQAEREEKKKAKQK